MCANDHGAEVVSGPCCGVRFQSNALGSALAGTQSSNDIVTLQCIFNVVRSNVERRHFPCVKPNAHGRFYATVLNALYVGHRGELRHNIALNDVGDLTQRSLLWDPHGKVETGIRTVSTANLNERIFRAIRELQADLAKARGELCQRIGTVLVELHPRRDNALSGGRSGLYVVNAGNGICHPLDGLGDKALHRLCRRAGVGRDDLN